MPKPKSSAFDVKMTVEERNTLAHDLCLEITGALDARQATIGDGGTIDLLDWGYEQGRTAPSDRPFPGAADLTSYFITENVDAMRARILKTIFGVEPFCVVDGWGVDAAKTAQVEAFHEWQVYEEGLPEVLSVVAHGALLEDCFILEVRERIETRRHVEEVDVMLQTTEDGAPIFTDGHAAIQMDEDGEPVPAEPGKASARVKRNYTKTRRLGPEYDAISMKDFVFLPGHAKSNRQVWGYAKRCWLRTPELKERADDGVYDTDAVEAMGTQSDRHDSGNSPAADVAAQQGPSVEKELFEVSLKRDLDNDLREEWYVATVSLKHKCLLRLKLDTLVMKVGKPRCVPFVLCPRRDSIYGYSYAEKLVTLWEEHTALRNMKADRSALATNAPIKRLQGSIWDPDTQPFGVGNVIDVRDMGEVEAMAINDVPPSVIEQERALIAAKERVGGLSDMAVGVQAGQSRTLGENQMVQAGSAVRVEELVDHFRSAISVVMELRHAIWEEALDADKKGLQAPLSVSNRMGEDFSGTFTADMLKGHFRFKPYGSVETANTQGQLQSFNGWLELLMKFGQINPLVGQVLQNPDVIKALMEEGARVYKVRNSQVFLKALMPQPQAMLPAAGGMDAGGGQAQPMGGQPPDIASLMAMLGGGAHAVN